MADINSGEFLEFRKRKKWVDKKSGHNGFMFYARWLDVTWGNQSDGYWTWDCYKETSDENTVVAKLVSVCFLNVRGRFKMSDLSPGILYEIAFVVKLTTGGNGWELPVTLYISLPNGKGQKRLVSLLEKPRGKWIELNGGCFRTENGETREVCFDLMEHGGHWKNGLIIKGIIVRPKN